MNDALSAVLQAQTKKVFSSSKAGQYKSSAPRTWLEWTQPQKAACVQVYIEGNYNNHIMLHHGSGALPLNTLRTWVNKVQQGAQRRRPF